jgi:hypothetical protein
MYMKRDVERLALEHWGSVSALNIERARRQSIASKRMRTISKKKAVRVQELKHALENQHLSVPSKSKGNSVVIGCYFE